MEARAGLGSRCIDVNEEESTMPIAMGHGHDERQRQGRHPRRISPPYQFAATVSSHDTPTLPTPMTSQPSLGAPNPPSRSVRALASFWLSSLSAVAWLRTCLAQDVKRQAPSAMCTPPSTPLTTHTHHTPPRHSLSPHTHFLARQTGPGQSVLLYVPFPVAPPPTEAGEPTLVTFPSVLDADSAAPRA